MFKEYTRKHWYIFVIAAVVGIFMAVATNVIWPAQGPTIINRTGVATLYRDGVTYYCFWLGENQYNDTVFPSEKWANGEVVLVPMPTSTIEGTLDTISTNTRLDAPDFYTYWFVNGEGFYSDTLVGTLVIPVNRTQPPWETGKAYKVEYTIEPDWWANIIAWEGL